MGAIFRTDADGNHVSTGKHPFPAGEVHEPQWGQPMPDHGMLMRQCQFDGCDLDDWTKPEPERVVVYTDDFGVTGPRPADFAHDEVRLRVPAGTDPLQAIRTAMGAFMERTDGTNALPWWTRVRWWHGGPAGFKRGDLLLPPAQTGVIPGLPITDPESVYITSDRDKALMFAARHNQPRLYEVTKTGEPQRDNILPDDDECWRCPSAMVYRVEVPSNLELRRVLYELES